ITGRDGVIVYVNPAFQRITAFSSAEAVGATPRLLRSEEQEQEFYVDLWATILRGEPFRGTLVNRRRDGRLFPAEQTITPMRDPHTGEISHFVSVLRDLTERTRFREQETELRLAAAVQRRLYPDPLPQVAGFDIAGSMVPALTTCGDYFDLVDLPDGRLAIVVADACGHGVGPALIMAETRALLRSALRKRCEVEGVVREINRQLFADLESHLYVTMVLGLLDPATGALTWANMGHPEGFVLDRAGAEASTLASTCLPLGLFQHLGDDPGRTTLLSHGDLLVLVTDGVQEARSAGERELGSTAVRDVVRRCRQGTAGEIAAAVIAAARDHAGGRPQEDDMTVVVIKRDAREA
ncbi:MAG TPA: SpoIIE family protein phosphatase, partial [Thermoleophilia bacterium]|nr:SpoIIE family protein phosphatase [Thermoleophilia bacterium]